MLPPSLRNLIEQFETLPGVGPRQAARFVFSLLRRAQQSRIDFANALRALAENITRCQRCFRVMESPQQKTCGLCNDPSRDTVQLCIVVNDMDVEALEAIGCYRGLYHVLGGHIDPIEKERNRFLAIDALMKRLQQEPINEVITAVDATTEGDTTADELLNLLQQHANGVSISRLGRGLSTGSEIEYMDTDTLRHALDNRIQTKN